MKTYTPYEGTAVPVERSKEAIKKLFNENGVVANQFSENNEQETAQIMWARKVIIEQDGQKREMVQPCRIKVCYHGHTLQQIFRALYYHLKAKFEIVKFGIIDYETEFLPYFVTMMPDGTQATVAERMVPGLMEGRVDIMPLPLPARRENDGDKH
jgi:hypothetical protein